MNDPAPAEVAVGVRFGFDVRLPSELGARSGPGAGQRPPLPGPRLRAVTPEVLPIGAAFAAALQTFAATDELPELRARARAAESELRAAVGGQDFAQAAAPVVFCARFW